MTIDETEAQPPSPPPVGEAPPFLTRRPKPEPPVLKALALYLFLIFVGAALIAPRFHASVQFLADGHFRLRGLAEAPFHKYVTRCLQLLALVGLPSFLKALRIPSGEALGLRAGPTRVLEWFQGLAWGAAATILIAVFALTFHSRTLALEHSPAEWSRQLKGALIAAILVSIIEEIIFRGALFGTLRRRYSFWPAALIGSGVYAILHFFQKPSELDQVYWYSGFVVLGEMLGGFTQWRALIPGFLNLVLLGLILALAFERTGAIFFSMGLHAGVVFCGVKYFSFLLKETPGASPWIWGSSKLIDGWMTGLLLAAILAVLYRTLPNWNPREHDS